MNDTRLTELESRLAHHERAGDEMSAVLAEQARALDALSERLRLLTDRVAVLAGGNPPSDDRPPPHY